MNACPRLLILLALFAGPGALLAQDYALTRGNDGYAIQKGGARIEIAKYHVTIKNADGRIAIVDDVGNLQLQGLAIIVSPPQRRALTDYAAAAHRIVAGGEQLASDAAALAANRVGDAINSFLVGPATGKSPPGAADDRAFRAEGLALCRQVEAARAAQDRAAEAVPAFRPFALIAAHDVDECRRRIVNL